MEIISITKDDLQKMIAEALQPLRDEIELIKIMLKGKPMLTVHEFAHQSGYSVDIVRKLASAEGYHNRRIEFSQLTPGGKIMIPATELVSLKQYVRQGSFEFDK